MSGGGEDILLRFGGGFAPPESRAEIFALTAEAGAAALRPKDPGAWSHALRAALAARLALGCGLEDVAGRYREDAGEGPLAALASPDETGEAQGLGAVVAFADRVGATPREATAEDIGALRAAGVSDADIVRLAELVAFLAYQFRLLAGIRLLAAEAGR